MITVEIKNDTRVIGRMEIRRLAPAGEISLAQDSEQDNYEVNMMVDRGDAIGYHQRVLFQFPRLTFNSFELVKAALQLFDKEQLELEETVLDLADKGADKKWNLARWRLPK